MYEIEFLHDGAWHFHHQHPSQKIAEHDAVEYAQLLKTPFRARQRTASEELALRE